MKKNILIPIIIAAVICLVLIAVFCFRSCDTAVNPDDDSTDSSNGTNDNGQSGENNSGKIERGTVTTSENPLLQVLFQTLADKGWSYTFNEDGTCGDQVYWWIENDTEKSMTIMVASEYKWKYQIGIMIQGEYASIQPWSAMYNGDSFVDWMPPYPTYEVPYAAKIERGTVTTSENPLLPILLESIGSKYTFKEDGTCSDTEYWWIENETENSIEIYISDEYKLKRSYELYKDNNNKNIAQLIVKEAEGYRPDGTVCWAEGGAISVPCFELHPLYSTLLDVICGEWKSSDRSATFYENGTCIMGGEDLTWEFDDIFEETDTDSGGYTDLAIIGIYRSGNTYTHLTISVHKDGYYKIDDMYLSK